MKSRSVVGLFCLSLSLAPLGLLTGCGKKVTRITTNSTVDLSGKWNDTDSRLVAEAMMKDVLGKPWLVRYEERKKTPRLVVSEIRNKSHEHINTQTFAKDIERELLNSGRVEFVASKSERDQLRDEKSDQQQNASVETRLAQGEESGANVMLIGTINTIVDQEGDQAVLYYQVNMELVEIESNKKLWIGEHKIKKLVERSSTKF